MKELKPEDVTQFITFFKFNDQTIKIWKGLHQIDIGTSVNFYLPKKDDKTGYITYSNMEYTVVAENVLSLETGILTVILK